MRCDMWFGTQEYSQWIPTPLSGADVSPSAWGASGTFLNGQGYAINSPLSHKRYNFSWGSTSARETAQLMKSFFDGSFGRGKLYFQDPLTYTTNVIPARWASPSITCDFAGPSLVPGVNPQRVPAPVGNRRLPSSAAYFDLSGVVIPLDNEGLDRYVQDHALFIPVPDGMQLNMGAVYASDPSSTIVAIRAVQGGGVGDAAGYLTKLTPGASNLLPDIFTKNPGDIGFYVLIFPIAGSGESMTLHAMHARLSPVGGAPGGPFEWVGGQGNEGVRFTGPPTYINNTGRDGGQVEFSATFTESVI